MKSNQINKSLAFSEKSTTSKYPLDQTFLPHFIKKTHVYYLKCRERDTDFLNIQVTKCRQKDNKRQKKERIDE